MVQFFKFDDGTLVNLCTVTKISQDEIVLLDGDTVSITQKEKERLEAEACGEEHPVSEISRLTSAIRDLRNLLQARLH